MGFLIFIFVTPFLCMYLMISHVPGFAFKHSFPYLELQELDLRRLTSNDTQRQFYQVNNDDLFQLIQWNIIHCKLDKHINLINLYLAN